MLDTIITSWLGYVVTAVVSIGATFLYHKQEKNKRELENANQKIKNDSDSNSEWQRLLEERATECARTNETNRKLMDRLEEVYAEKRKLRDELSRMQEERIKASYYKGLYEISRCDVISCKDRRPPIDVKALLRVDEDNVSAEEGNDKTNIEEKENGIEPNE